jgi:hypothetical protein
MQLENHRLLVLSDFGRPTLRSFTASRSLGSISHTDPTLIAFNRLASISARTLLWFTPNLRAASTRRLSRADDVHAPKYINHGATATIPLINYSAFARIAQITRAGWLPHERKPALRGVGRLFRASHSARTEAPALPENNLSVLRVYVGHLHVYAEVLRVYVGHLHVYAEVLHVYAEVLHDYTVKHSSAFLGARAPPPAKCVGRLFRASHSLRAEAPALPENNLSVLRVYAEELLRSANS